MKRSTEGEQEPNEESDDDSRANAEGPPEAVHDKADRVAGETFEPVGATTGEFPAEKIAPRGGRRTITTGRGAFLVGAGILLSRIVGVIRQRVFAYFLGNSDAMDAFNAAFRIPNFLQNVFGEGALSASFIPVYARLLAQDDEEEADRVAWSVFSMLALVVSALVLEI